MRNLSSFKRWVWAAAAGIALLICATVIISTLSLRETGIQPAQTAEVLLIAPPTQTPIPPAALIPTPTPTQEVAMINGIGVGAYVQISGTDGAGLRLRSAPGTDSTPLFLGMDTEVFQVKDGPRMANDLVWWYLASPYDETRAGWAAASFLTYIPANNQ